MNSIELPNESPSPDAVAANNVSDHIRPGTFDRVLFPVHQWIWSDTHRRGKKLLRFAETEADGERDLARAAETTGDGLLRRLYIRHAQDEQRHAHMFRRRGRAVLTEARLAQHGTDGIEANWLTPGERGLDDLTVEREKDGPLLAFLHLSERAAAERFEIYRRVLENDPVTRDVFAQILRDEAFHMNYTYTQLKRVSPKHYRFLLWKARATRLWKLYLRAATAIAGVMGAIVLTIQYFIFLPLFAFFAKRAARGPAGWTQPSVARSTGNATVAEDIRRRTLSSQY